MKPSKKLIGPFSQAEEIINGFAENMFLSHLLTETIDNWEKIKREYDEAESVDDSELMRKKKLELDACMASLSIAAQICNIGEGLDI